MHHRAARDCYNSNCLSKCIIWVTESVKHSLWKPAYTHKLHPLPHQLRDWYIMVKVYCVSDSPVGAQIYCSNISNDTAQHYFIHKRLCAKSNLYSPYWRSEHRSGGQQANRQGLFSQEALWIRGSNTQPTAWKVIIIEKCFLRLP